MTKNNEEYKEKLKKLKEKLEAEELKEKSFKRPKENTSKNKSNK